MNGLSDSGPSSVNDVACHLRQVRAGKKFPLCAKYVRLASAWDHKRFMFGNEEMKNTVTSVFAAVEEKKSVYKSVKMYRRNI